MSTLDVKPQYVMTDVGPLRILTLAVPKGAYWIGGPGVGIGFHLTHRPNIVHRWFCRVLLGWQWRDAP